jgi:hypothetical protein
MARQRALYERILANGNLCAGQRSLIVGHLAKPFFQQIKDRRKNMEKTVYNPQKGRLEPISIDFTDENPTWFDECEDSHGIFSITDLQGRLNLSALPLRRIQSRYRPCPRQSKSTA